MSLTAPVNRILPYSVVDGPGNRVAIFFQSCNLRCRYCHNPETNALCVSCGKCVEGCPAGALRLEDGRVVWLKEKCVKCDRCIAVCPNHASPKVIRMTPEQVFAEVERSMPFIRGLTTSGGECGLYPEFLTRLYALAHEKKLSCLMDTNGTIELSKYPALMDVCDGAMLDVKAWDAECFRALTGGDSSIVRRNLVWLHENDKLEEMRIVVLDGCVDAEATIEGIADTLGREAIGAHRLKLIRFRSFGVRGALENTPSPTLERMEVLRALAQARGFREIVIL